MYKTQVVQADIVYLLLLLIVCPVRFESQEGSWPLRVKP